MKREELKKIISECCNDVLFMYNGKQSGITSEVYNYIPTFQVWHGAEIKEYSDIDVLLADKFYSGKSIDELIGKVEFTFA